MKYSRKQENKWNSHEHENIYYYIITKMWFLLKEMYAIKKAMT